MGQVGPCPRAELRESRHNLSKARDGWFAVHVPHLDPAIAGSIEEQL